MNPDFTAFPEIDDLQDTALTARLQARIDNKTKPPGSLGRLEALAVQLGQILGTEAPALRAPQMLVCVADHGLAAHGISAYPSDVTWQMVENFLGGGACVSVLARQHGLSLTVVDCGVKHTFSPRPGLLVRKVAFGSADSHQGPAMTEAECQHALSNGQAIVRELPGNALLLGEMGIGNTSAAALLMARLTGIDLQDCVGSGTGVHGNALKHKQKVLREVLRRHSGVRDPLQVLAAMGGLEIATLVGAIWQAAHERRVIVVDGFIVSAAVLVAHAVRPHVLQRCVFAHQSGEAGHARMLRHLGVQPLLDLGLRLGEGSGAALAWPLLVSACRILSDMASFETAGVSRQGEGH